jgi:cobalamin-dependent methionine synthase I
MNDKKTSRSPATFINSVPIEVPLKMILVRLGYRKTKTMLSQKQRDTLDETISDGFSLCKPQGCFRLMNIAEKKSDIIVLEDGSVLRSISLTELLHNSTAVAIMASTIGPEIVKAASDALTHGDGATAVILDAVGGQSANETLNWINEFIRSQLSRSAQKLTPHRFSPGFGDFDLENQKTIYSLLELDRLDLQLTSRYMLVPEKSVTAIAGIEKE